MIQLNSHVIYSFFSGLGFLDLGFESEGFRVRYINEIHGPFLDGYIHARRKSGVDSELRSMNEPIELISGRFKDEFRKLMSEDQKENAIIFIGGPPCPDFSVGGKNRGAAGENGRLSAEYARLIIAYRPDIFLFENVKGLWRTAKHRAFYEDLKRDFERAGYKLHERLCNALEFGVAQDRDRVILIGTRFDSKKIESPNKLAVEWDSYMTFPSIHKNVHRNNKDGTEIPKELCISHFFKMNNVQAHPNSINVFKPRAGLAKFTTIEEGDCSKKSFKRLSRFSFSPTAAYGNNEVHIHPTEPRRISVAEALAIQSMPQSFELPQSMSLTNMFKGIGNGVPYLMARGVAKLIGVEFLGLTHR